MIRNLQLTFVSLCYNLDFNYYLEQIKKKTNWISFTFDFLTFDNMQPKPKFTIILQFAIAAHKI